MPPPPLSLSLFLFFKFQHNIYVTKWKSPLFPISCRAGLILGYYGNEDVRKGIINGADAIIRANSTVHSANTKVRPVSWNSGWFLFIYLFFLNLKIIAKRDVLHCETLLLSLADCSKPKKIEKLEHAEHFLAGQYFQLPIASWRQVMIIAGR